MRVRVLPSVFVAVAVTGAVLALLLLRSGGPDNPPQPQTSIEQALADFVTDRFGIKYLGRCPRKFPEDGEVPQGMCSGRASSTGGRVFYRVGHPFSEWIGEATFARDASGSWHLATFERYPPLGA
jgi:hypothetical protein